MPSSTVSDRAEDVVAFLMTLYDSRPISYRGLDELNAALETALSLRDTLRDDWFDPRPIAIAHTGADTSIEAANAIRPKARGLRGKLLAHLRKTSGRTDEEIQYDLMMSPNTERPRRCELVKLGLVVDSGARRKTLSGRNAIIWVASEPCQGRLI